MTQNSGMTVLLLSVVTCGLYMLYWFYKTGEEMNAKFQAGIPSFILFFVFSPYWIWKWAQGVEKVTKGGTSAAMAFIFVFFLPAIGAMLIQNKFNEVGGAPAAA